MRCILYLIRSMPRHRTLPFSLLPVLVLHKLVIVSLYIVISGGTYHIIRLCGRCTPKRHDPSDDESERSGKFRAAPKKTEKDYLRVSAITIIITIQLLRAAIWCIAASNVSRKCVKVPYTVCDDNLDSFNHGAENAGGSLPCLTITPR